MSNILNLLTQGLTTGFARFMVSAALPVFLAIAGNLLLLRLLDEASFELIQKAFSSASTIQGSLALVLFVAATQLLSNMNPFFLETLEGRLPERLVRLGRTIHTRRLRRLTTDLQDANVQLHSFGKMAMDNKSMPAAELETRRDAGDPIYYWDVANREQVERAAERGETIKAPEEAVRYGRGRWRYETVALQNQLSFTYPALVAEASNDSPDDLDWGIMIAPTQLGNIGLTIRAYALSRYSLDLALLWTRLQRTINNSSTPDKFSETLGNSRAQLDFAVSMVFLSAASFIGWTSWLLYDLRGRWLALVLVAGLGPLLTSFFYRLACLNYVAFGDHVRTAVDCYRLDLLKDLKMPQPRTTREEQLLWKQVGGRLGYGNRVGFSYREP